MIRGSGCQAPRTHARLPQRLLLRLQPICSPDLVQLLRRTRDNSKNRPEDHEDGKELQRSWGSTRRASFRLTRQPPAAGCCVRRESGFQALFSYKICGRPLERCSLPDLFPATVKTSPERKEEEKTRKRKEPVIASVRERREHTSPGHNDSETVRRKKTWDGTSNLRFIISLNTCAETEACNCSLISHTDRSNACAAAAFGIGKRIAGRLVTDKRRRQRPPSYNS